MIPMCSLAQQAEGRIKVATTRLAGRYPFHAKVLERFQMRSLPGLETIGVTVDGVQLLLLHNPEFVLQTPADELVGVLLHEVHHVVLGHVLADAKDFPDEWARTVAEEVTVNEFVREPLPDDVIKLEQFPGLPPLESTRQRYTRLTKVRQRFPICSLRMLVAESAGRENTSEENGAKYTVDDHGVWKEARKNAQAAREVIRGVLQQAVLEAGTAGLADALRVGLQGLGVGTEPGQEQYHLRGDRQGRLDWRSLLRRYLAQVLEAQPVLHRPPRRFPELVGILPARSRRPLRPHVMAVIDTSGSITDELLEMIDGELRCLAHCHVVTVVECDDVIHKVAKYSGLTSVIGRGGTDFRPPLEKEFLRRQRPNVVIYFTDGLGTAPEQAPRMPVIWCLVPDGSVPASWGRVVHMRK